MICLVGPTCSGKTTVLNELTKLGYGRVVTMTTRPMRPGEIEGQTYYYRSKEEFNRLIHYDFFAETTSYNVANGETWYYGTPKEELFGDKAIILNPDGLKSLAGKYKMKVFHLWVPEEVIRQRLIQRGDDPKEADRRVAADERDFEDIAKYVDYFIPDYYETPANLATKIKSLYELDKAR